MDTNCCRCNKLLVKVVMRTDVGYYYGTYCPNCGPYSRLSEYYKSRDLCIKGENLEVALDKSPMDI